MSEAPLKVVFLGTPDFAVPALKVLLQSTEVRAVYTQPDKPVGRGLKVQASPVKKIAEENGIPVFTPEKISAPEELDRLRSFDADFLVVVAYGQILKMPVIEAPRYGCINIHSSLLPRWRGAAPIHWALLSGDCETGVTTMLIVPKLDAGDILLQEKTIISDDDTLKTLHDRLAEMGGRLILPTLDGLKEGKIIPRIQNENEVTHANKLTKEMEKLDWKKSSREVDLKVRALNPWPGVRIKTANGLSLKIKKGKPRAEMQKECAGKLYQLKEELMVGCAQGSYQVLELQEEGKKSVPASDFLNGLRSRKIDLPVDLVSY